MRKFSLLLCLLPGLALAADWQSCRRIEDSSARLQCYDNAADALAHIAPPAAVASDAAAPAVAPPVAPVMVSSPVALAAPPAPVVNAEQGFGMENRAPEGRLEQLQSRILGSFKGWEPKQKITLENGQVWQIVDGSSAYLHVENPQVNIERGMLGAFYLKIEGINKRAKVKRIK